MVVRLSDSQLGGLQALKLRSRDLGQEPKATVSSIIRSAIDRKLESSTQEAEGWGFLMLPPVPHQKLRILVNQGTWTDVNAAVQHAISAYLDELTRAPELPQFEQRFLRDRVYSGAAEDSNKQTGKGGKRK